MLDRSTVHLGGRAQSRRGPPEFFLSGRGRLPLGLFPATATYALVWASCPIPVSHMLGAACQQRSPDTTDHACITQQQPSIDGRKFGSDGAIPQRRHGKRRVVQRCAWAQLITNQAASLGGHRRKVWRCCCLFWGQEVWAT